MLFESSELADSLLYSITNILSMGYVWLAITASVFILPCICKQKVSITLKKLKYDVQLLVILSFVSEKTQELLPQPIFDHKIIRPG